MYLSGALLSTQYFKRKSIQKHPYFIAASKGGYGKGATLSYYNKLINWIYSLDTTILQSIYDNGFKMST